MNLTGNTILITGGGSGIGLALARQFLARGNTVVIAGRTSQKLNDACDENPGLQSMQLDVTDPADIRRVAADLRQQFPALNLLINNAGVMRPENVASGDTETAEATIDANLLGPIRMTAALLPQLLEQPAATVITVSSGLAFVPLAMTPTYCATKAAIHSYCESLRRQLRSTNVDVVELIPPYVQTTLMGEQQQQDERAMPLEEFIDEVMAILASHPDATEIVVDRCKPLRFAVEQGTYARMFTELNDAMQGDR